MYDEPYLLTEFLSKWAEKIMKKSVQEAAIFVSIILHHKEKQINTVGMFFFVLAST